MVIDFFLFCVTFFSIMCLTLLILWGLLVVCDVAEDFFRNVIGRYKSRGKY